VAEHFTWAERAALERINSQRINWADIAKGLCIALVVMMHSNLGVEAAMGGEGPLHQVVAFCKPFRIPAFFMISGLFLARTIDRDWRSYADRRVVHFAYFYLLWLVIQSALKYGAVSGGSVEGFARHLVLSLVEPFASLWFIYLLAVFSVAVKLLRRVPAVVLLGAAAALEILPVSSSSGLVQEFCERFVYFVAGYLCAGPIVRLARGATARRGAALLGLSAFAGANGFLALTPSGVAGFGTLAALPFVSLALGLAGAAALVALSALLAETVLAPALRYLGEHSIVVYLAFFLPMAAARTLLLKTGMVTDIGLASLLVSAAALTGPLVFERLVRDTPLRFLFVRPKALRLRPVPGRPTLEAAE
jgi:uncharacterized membrane protein YcfT